MLCKYCKYELDGEDILEALSKHPMYSNYTPQQLEETARMYGWTPENRKCFKNEVAIKQLNRENIQICPKCRVMYPRDISKSHVYYI